MGFGLVLLIVDEIFELAFGIDEFFKHICQFLVLEHRGVVNSVSIIIGVIKREQSFHQVFGSFLFLDHLVYSIFKPIRLQLIRGSCHILLLIVWIPHDFFHCFDDPIQPRIVSVDLPNQLFLHFVEPVLREMTLHGGYSIGKWLRIGTIQLRIHWQLVYNIDISRYFHFSPNMKKIEFLMITLCIGVIIGYTYGIDIPQALEVPLRQSPYNFTTFQFNLMYIMMYLPIMLFDIPLGNLTDRFSPKKIILILLIVSFLSQILQALMFQYTPGSYYPFVLIARAIFGLGGDGIYTVQGIILAKYCSDNYQFLTSVAWGFGYSADAISSIITTLVYDSTNSVSAPVYIGALVSGFSLISGILLVLALNRQERKQSEALAESILSKQGEPQEMKEEENRSIIADIKSMTNSFWIVIFGIFCTEASCGSFIDNSNDLLVKRFGFAYLEAGRLGMIPFSALTVLSIVAGKFLSDYPKYRRIAYLAASLQFFIATIFLYFLPNCESPSALHYVVVVVFLLSMSSTMGIFYSGLFTCIPFGVEERVVGTAWGIAGMAIGAPSCITPLIYSWIVSLDEDNLAQGYLNLTMASIILTFCTLIHSMHMYFGPFGLLDLKFKEIEAMRREGKSLEQIIDQYGDQ